MLRFRAYRAVDHSPPTRYLLSYPLYCKALVNRAPYFPSFMEYVVFSDESSYTQGRFRSIAAVSLPYGSPSCINAISAELGRVLECSEKGELKWRNIGRGGQRNVERANAAVDFVISRLSQGLRLDIVTWDIEDSRHSVEERDDCANYCRMYFHLHRSLMRRRNSGARWHLHPDELSIIDWGTIRDCLTSDGTWHQRDRAGQFLLESEEVRQIAPHIKTFGQVDSAQTPFVQLADLFAGMAAYTRKNPEIILALLALEKQETQPALFPADSPVCSMSQTDRGRFRVISHLNQSCKREKLGVSLETKGYLYTPNPQSPINFWHYMPQHSHDKAPTKNRGLSS